MGKRHFNLDNIDMYLDTDNKFHAFVEAPYGDEMMLIDIFSGEIRNMVDGGEDMMNFADRYGIDSDNILYTFTGSDILLRLQNLGGITAQKSGLYRRFLLNTFPNERLFDYSRHRFAASNPVNAEEVEEACHILENAYAVESAKARKKTTKMLEKAIKKSDETVRLSDLTFICDKDNNISAYTEEDGVLRNIFIPGDETYAIEPEALNILDRYGIDKDDIRDKFSCHVLMLILSNKSLRSLANCKLYRDYVFNHDYNAGEYCSTVPVKVSDVKDACKIVENRRKKFAKTHGEDIENSLEMQ